MWFRVTVTAVAHLYCCSSNPQFMSITYTKPNCVDRRTFSSNGYTLIIWNQITYSWQWWHTETLFRSLVPRVHWENSSHKPYLDDKQKSQPHRKGFNIITESKLTALHSFWNNLFFTLYLNSALVSNWS